MPIIYYFLLCQLFFLVIYLGSLMIKNRIYNKSFSNINYNTNISSYQFVLDHFYEDCEFFNNKLKKYIYVSKYAFYFRNLFIVSTISTFIYLLINYNNIETLSYYLELTFYLITGIEILILIFSLLYYKTKPFESINITDKTKDI